MANIQYEPGNGAYAPPSLTFDITSVVAERVGSYVNYYSFDTDGTMFVLHTTGVAQPDGTVVQTIVGWDHFSGSTVLQSATADLPLQPFLDNLNSRNPSSAKAMAHFLSGDDQLTGSHARDTMMSGAGADSLSGGNGNDRLSAGAGADRLIGGLGGDVMTGGADADHFVFASAAEGGDRLSDFSHGQDKIELFDAAFGLGTLTEGANFIHGTQATQAEATLLYDGATGVLRYDADGTGSGAAVVLATLTNHAALTVSDFLLV